MESFRRTSVVLSFLAAPFLLLPPAGAQSYEPPGANPRLIGHGEHRVKAPLHFEENRGQHDPRVAFSARAENFELFLTRDGEAWLLGAPPEAGGAGRSLRLRLAGARRDAPAAGSEPARGKVSYFRGNDPAQWQRGLPTFGKAKYSEVYSGIDWVFRPSGERLEYDFVLAPGADPGAIALLFDDPLHPTARPQLRLAVDGSLRVGIGGEEMRFAAPQLYQTGEDGVRREVAGRYRLEDDRVGFAVGDYDRRRELVIDPILLYASYLGGSGNDFTARIDHDGDGNVYLATMTFSTDFPTRNALQPAAAGSWDLAVTKLDPTASEILYSTYIGGSGYDAYPALEAVADGLLVFMGIAGSATLPMVNSWDPTGDNGDVALFKLAPDGSEILFSTYYGGSSADVASANLGSYGTAAVSVDAAGRIYFGGLTYSDDLPVTANAFQPIRAPGEGCALLPHCPDSFVAVFSPDGQTLVYATYYGAPGEEIWPLVVTAAPDGDAILVGTRVPEVGLLPVRNAYQPAPAGGGDIYLARLPIDGSPPRFATYFGGSYGDGANAAVDAEGRVVLAGTTNCANFPILYSESPLCAPPGSPDTFVARFNARGTGLDFATLYGGTGWDFFNALDLDAAGNAALFGYNTWIDYPWVDPVQPIVEGTNAIAGYLHATGPQMLFATQYGSGGAFGEGGAIRRSDDSIWLSGPTYSEGLTLTADAVQPSPAGDVEVYFAAFQTREAVLATPSRLPVTAGGEVEVPVLLSAGGLNLAALSFVLPIPACFEFDPADLDANGVPDDLLLDFPAGFSQFVVWNAVDRELGVVVYDASLPFARLPTGTLLRIRLSAVCTPPSSYTDVELPFSTDPAPTFGLDTGYDAPGSALTGSLRLFGGLRGDCNGNGVVTSADLPACVLEIFDTDGDFWLDAIHSTFAGNPFGCDSNGDSVIDAGDLACTARLVLGQTCAPALEDGAPPVRLLLPALLAGTAGEQVMLPIRLETGGQTVRSLVFSLDLPAGLSFDPEQGIGGLPPGFAATVRYLPGRTFGELQVAIPPGPVALANGTVLEMELDATAVAGSAAIAFGVEPRASWGGGRGESLEGEVAGRTRVTLSPPGALFYDGFETGDPTRWSAVAGGVAPSP